MQPTQPSPPPPPAEDTTPRRPTWATRSPAQTRRIQTQNRRLEYLRRHPAYVASSEREFVDVQRYDRLVRRFQTPEERTAEARDKGFGQVLEASILRNPEPLQRVGEEEEEEEEEEEDQSRKMEVDDDDDNDDDDDPDDPDDPDNLDNPDNPDNPHTPRDKALRRWHAHVRDWFVRGGAADDGFDYAAVDDDSDYDALARADAQDAWFDEEEPDSGTNGTGETGVQDF